MLVEAGESRQDHICSSVFSSVVTYCLLAPISDGQTAPLPDLESFLVQRRHPRNSINRHDNA